MSKIAKKISVCTYVEKERDRVNGYFLKKCLSVDGLAPTVYTE